MQILHGYIFFPYTNFPKIPLYVIVQSNGKCDLTFNSEFSNVPSTPK